MTKIDKAVPLPPSGSGPQPRYPWRELQIGDSFFVPDSDFPQLGPHEVQARVASYGWSRAQRNKRLKYRTRRVVEDGVHGVRVWRVAVRDLLGQTAPRTGQAAVVHILRGED